MDAALTVDSNWKTIQIGSISAGRAINHRWFVRKFMDQSFNLKLAYMSYLAHAYLVSSAGMNAYEMFRWIEITLAHTSDGLLVSSQGMPPGKKPANLSQCGHPSYCKQKLTARLALSILLLKLTYLEGWYQSQFVMFFPNGPSWTSLGHPGILKKTLRKSIYAALPFVPAVLKGHLGDWRLFPVLASKVFWEP